nr:sestrin-3-like [Anolis sagrei ordinatus]
MSAGGDTERAPQLYLAKALSGRSRREALTQQMGLHPPYLESFLRMQHYLLHMDGPLPFDCRHYIAIMAAARHRCRYLVNLHVLQFLRLGGDPLWLRGLDYIPPKLRKLSEINKILAHRPWLVGKEHIEKLLKTGEQSWSLAELVHAVVLLAHYHALASFAFGCETDLCPEGRALLRLGLPGGLCFCDAGHGAGTEGLPLGRKRVFFPCALTFCTYLLLAGGDTSKSIHTYDDYDYAEVNHLLERLLKLYIKTVTCFPEKMNPEMFERFWKQFKHSEKVHVNLLILEARLQAELLYALRAITHHMVS